MNGRPDLYRPLDWALLRAPLLPAADDVGTPDSAPTITPRERAALTVGSPDLVAAFDRAVADGEYTPRLRQSLRRYHIRMRTRPTPFGLFAGVGLISWGERTSAMLSPSSPRPRSRPEPAWLTEVVDALEHDPLVRPELRAVAHPALLVAHGRVYATCSDPVASVRLTAAVEHALTAARPSILVSTLVDTLSALPGATPEKARELVDTLWNGGFLVSDLRAPLTADPVEHVRAKLAEIPSAVTELRTLEAVADSCARVMDPDVDDLTEVLTALHRPGPGSSGGRAPAPRVQTDSLLDLSGHEVHDAVAAEAARAAELLLRMSPLPHGPTALKDYRRAFELRYGRDRMVPLLELIDPERGLGLPDSTSGPVNREASATRDRTLLALAMEAAHDHRRIVHLDNDLIARLSTWTPGDGPAPPTLDLSVFLTASTPEAVDSGDFLAVVGPNVGAPTAGRTLGRFATLLGPRPQQFLTEIARLESDARRTLLVEISYRPRSSRAANVTVRPAIHTHEIAVGVSPGVDAKNVIAVDELLVGVTTDGIRIHCPTRDADLTVVQGHMLSSAKAPPVVRFLLAVAADARCCHHPFHWGPAASLPALPRIQTGRLVLSLAQWRPDDQLLGALERGDADAVASWRARWSVPREVYMTVADNRLLLDLEAHQDVVLFCRELRRDDQPPIVEEALPGRQDAWLPGPGGRHIAELVVPLALTSLADGNPHTDPSARPARSGAQKSVASPRPRHLPGGEWLYAKLYGPPSLDDDLIAGPLREFGEFATASGLSDGYFYLRYSDPDPHLRIRFHGRPDLLIGTLHRHLCEWAGDLVADGLRDRLTFDTYEPEIERYGGTAESLAEAERVFLADSPATAELVDLWRRNDLPDDRTTLAVMTVDDLLASLGLDRPRRLDVVRSVVGTSREGGRDYRRRQQELRHVVLRSHATLPGAAEAVLAKRRAALAPVAAGLGELCQNALLHRGMHEICAAFVHMHLNRLIGTDLEQEKGVLELLRRTYEGIDRNLIRSAARPVDATREDR